MLREALLLLLCLAACDEPRRANDSGARHYRGARGPAMRNRTTLRRAMQRAGFVPYAREWWHFSLPSEHPGLDVPY